MLQDPSRGEDDGNRLPVNGGRATDVEVWRLHIGVHKTATTHFQHTLEELRDGLADRGVDFLPLPRVRRSVRFRLLDPRLLAGGSVAADAIRKRIAPLRNGQPVVAISEENIIGGIKEAVSLTPYPRLGLRLRALSGLRPLMLFLSIRRFDEFVSASYAELLRSGPPKQRFADLHPRLVAQPPSWVVFVERLRRALPHADIRLWPYEDYRSNARRIAEVFCGVDPGPLPEMPPPTRTKTPSADAVRAAETLNRRLPTAEWRRRVAELFDAAGAGPDSQRFMPFDVAEREVFRRRYEADLDEIRWRHPGVLMEF